MNERLMQIVTKVACAIWCHRMVYAGLAAAYGAGCAGWVDKEMVNQIVTACYVALVIERDH